MHFQRNNVWVPPKKRMDTRLYIQNYLSAADMDFPCQMNYHVGTPFKVEAICKQSVKGRRSTKKPL